MNVEAYMKLQRCCLIFWIWFGLKEITNFWILVSSSSNWLQPYLHESRHRHALKRVRGSGGRFLSGKQLQRSNAEVVTGAHSSSDPVNAYQKKDASEVEIHPSRTGENASSITACSDPPSLSSNSVNFGQPELQFFGNSANKGGGASQCSEGLTFDGGTQCSSYWVRGGSKQNLFHRSGKSSLA